MNLSIPKHADFAVIGGGPAGSAVAALLARMGLQTVLLEKGSFPRDKLCGEFLSPEAIDLLDRVGCREAILRHQPSEIHHALFTEATGRCVEFALPGSAFGLSRRVLDDCLFHHARQCGAMVYEGVEVQSIQSESERLTLHIRPVSARIAQTITASWVIAAYGRRSGLDVQQGREFMPLIHPYVGFKCHHRIVGGSDIGDELKNRVEIHLFNGGYCGICLVEKDTVNVCMLAEQSFISSLSSVTWNAIVESLKQKNAFLQQRFTVLEALKEPMKSVAQVSFGRKEKSRGRILFVGDAAGMISPLCGDGQAMALQSAVLLAELIREKMNAQGHVDENLGAHWERLWNREFRNRMNIGYGLQWMLLNPLGAAMGIRAAQALPVIPRWLVKWTRGG